jgi:phage/plasmid-associated DNA primase
LINEHRLIGFTPDIFLIIQLPIIFNPNADCLRIKEIIRQIICKRDVWNKLNDDEKRRMSDARKIEIWKHISPEEQKKIDTIFEIFGYCLYADYYYHYLFLFQGPNDSGKGTLMKFLKRMLGVKGYASVPPQNLGDRFMAANLNGKYANICGDLSIERLKDTGIIKRLIGEDVITTEFKYFDSFQFTNYAKLISSLNDYFEISEKDLEYLVKKIWLIECDNVFPETKEYVESIMTEGEISGLFNESMKGLLRLINNDDFSWKPNKEKVKKKFPTYNKGGGRGNLQGDGKEYGKGNVSRTNEVSRANELDIEDLKKYG